MNIQGTIAFLKRKQAELRELKFAEEDLTALETLAERETALEQRIVDTDRRCEERLTTAANKITNANAKAEEIITTAKKDAQRVTDAAAHECTVCLGDMEKEKAALAERLKKLNRQFNTVHDKLSADQKELASLETKLEKARAAIASVK